MIKAVFVVDRNSDDITAVSVSGHANHADYGYDVVCAGVSVLVISTINALEDYVGIDTNVTVDSDATSFEVMPIDEYTRIQAQTLLHSLEMAMTGLSEEYDDFIKIEYQEVKK